MKYRSLFKPVNNIICCKLFKQYPKYPVINNTGNCLNPL